MTAYSPAWGERLKFSGLPSLKEGTAIFFSWCYIGGDALLFYFVLFDCLFQRKNKPYRTVNPYYAC